MPSHLAGTLPENPVSDIERRLTQAIQVLRVGRLDSHEWLLVATLLVGAAQALDCLQEPPSSLRTMFDQALEDLREETGNFGNPAFLKASKAARRHMPDLFKPRPSI